MSPADGRECGWRQTGDAQTFDVGAGTIILVPARMQHSFYDISERLALVFFGQAERSANLASK